MDPKETSKTAAELKHEEALKKQEEAYQKKIADLEKKLAEAKEAPLKEDPKVAELVSEKMAAGLTRDLAIEVARRQVEEDRRGRDLAIAAKAEELKRENEAEEVKAEAEKLAKAKK